MSESDIDGLRQEIDALDRSILDLMGKRAALAMDIGRLKENSGRSPFDPGRERDLLAALCGLNKSPLSEAAVRRIFLEIMSACRAIQGPTRVSFLGPAATFSHMAALSHFGGSCIFLPRGSISDVFREVTGGRADFGVVPVENSIEGAVGLTLDELAVSELKVCGEIFLPVSQALMSREEDLSRIRRVYSHPQALAQCRGWLAGNLPEAALVETQSTAAAAMRSVGEEGSAALGSEMLAERHGLKVLAGDVQDRPFNLTRFLVLGRLECPRSGRDKTSIIFTLPHQPGALRQVLSPLAEAGINLTRIESRPAKNGSWEYIFFVDFEGHLSDEGVREALAGLASVVVEFKLMGSYPAGETAARCSISNLDGLPGQAAVTAG